MDLFWKTIAAIILALIFMLSLGRGDMSLILSLIVCAMVCAAAVTFFQPVKELLTELEKLADLQDGLFAILLKCAGIALTAELASQLCQDAGSGSLGKTVRLLGNAVILYLSIPAFQAFLTLLKDILGEL